MARLIQSAALFLIYPAVLGLAPLDEFGAFKKWRGEFMGYILMAFGSIIGMNIFFLILPYINEFNWFGWNPYVDLPSMVINSLIIIVGLLSVKAFIAFISGLIGGKNAFDEGNGMKKDLGETVGKAAKWTAGAAHIGMAMTPAARFLRTGINIGVGKIKDKRNTRALNKAQRDLADDDTITSRVETASAGVEEEMSEFKKTSQYKNLEKRTQAKAKARGLDITGKDKDAYEQMLTEAADNQLTRDSKTYRDNKQLIESGGYNKNDQEKLATIENLTERRAAIRQAYYMDPETGSTNHGRNLFRADFLNAGQEIGGAFLKFIQEGIKDLNIPVKGIQGVFQMLDNNKYDKDGKYAGSYVSPVDQRAAGSAGGFGRQLGQNLLSPLKALGSVFTGRPGPGAPPGVVAPSDEKRTADTLARMEQTNQALLKAIEKLNRARP